MHINRFLVMSVAMNAVLAVLLLRSGAEPENTPATTMTQPNALADQEPTNGPDMRRDDLRDGTAGATSSWTQVASEDHQVYIANLRALGCPEETIRDIIIADVNRLYREKTMQALGTSQKYEYWKSASQFENPFLDKERIQRMAALEAEKQAVLSDLGIDMTQPTMAGGVDPMMAMLDFLPESKRVLLKKAMAHTQSNFAKYADELAINPSGTIRKIQRETEEAIQAVLTPEEYLDYQLRFSQTALHLRQNLSGFDPSEEEFLAIYKLRAQFDREYSPAVMTNQNGSVMANYSEAESQVKEQIRATLGDERYAEYERAQDQSFQQIQAIVKQAGLETTAANEVYIVKKAVDFQISELDGNQSFSAEERQAALQSIVHDAGRSVQEILGDDVWKKYDLPNNMWWLRGLAQQPASTTVEVRPKN